MITYVKVAHPHNQCKHDSGSVVAFGTVQFYVFSQLYEKRKKIECGILGTYSVVHVVYWKFEGNVKNVELNVSTCLNQEGKNCNILNW